MAIVIFFVDIECLGRIIDDGVFKISNCLEAIEITQLHVPRPHPLTRNDDWNLVQV